jgi:hypothetical protein
MNRKETVEKDFGTLKQFARTNFWSQLKDRGVAIMMSDQHGGGKLAKKLNELSNPRIQTDAEHEFLASARFESERRFVLKMAPGGSHTSTDVTLEIHEKPAEWVWGCMSTIFTLGLALIVIIPFRILRKKRHGRAIDEALKLLRNA